MKGKISRAGLNRVLGMYKTFKNLDILITAIYFNTIFVNSPIYNFFFNLGQGFYIIGGVLINSADLNCAIFLGHFILSICV